MSDLMFLQYLVPLFLEKGSLGLGLDAPKLEISKVVPGSPKNELCAALTFCFAMTSCPDSENLLEMLFHQYEVMAKMGQMCCIRSSLNAPCTETPNPICIGSISLNPF